ncbi:hypothetical protein [Colwellia ponticola]|uniref:Uncharacterized protein n=1 Tax=Colwellia ponticola TaxID=2304625 RepID=A0A8H2JMC0_9GAMM|nr:hypothetical protein [Colwellia ponticola]TMM46512.1 hypothetical protein FCS21_06040 [Colwellia ponticola]
MANIQLTALFKQYQKAFLAYDIDALSDCYHLPCTLNTPDKVVLLANLSDCHEEFTTIFTQLKQAKTSNIIAKQACFEKISKQVYLVCIDWDFIDGQGDVFADFTAIYHVLDDGGILKIINVISHELDSSLTLTEPLSW